MQFLFIGRIFCCPAMFRPLWELTVKEAEGRSRKGEMTELYDRTGEEAT